MGANPSTGIVIFGDMDRSPYYLKNKAKYMASARKSREKRKKFVDDLKRSPCVDCGGTFQPWQMQFDHLGDDKCDSVSNLIKTASMKAIEAEIAKCELVCANCHADRTYQRAQKKLTG